MACLEGRNSFAIYKFHVTKFRADSLERPYIPKTMLVVRLSFQGTCKKKKFEVSKMKYFLENLDASLSQSLNFLTARH